MSSWTFFREFVRRPTQVGSVIPSSKALARSVVDAAAIAPGQVVVELGAGTGPITSEIVARAPGTPLLCLEPAPDLARKLRHAVPGAMVLERKADRTLPDVVAGWGHPRVDRVVSGLPWTMWPAELQEEVLSGITSALAPHGRFVTYSYLNAQLSPSGLRFRDTLDQWFRHVWRSPVQWRNVPPAVVVVGDGPLRAGGRSS